MPVPVDAANVPMPSGYDFVRVLGSGGCGWVALARQRATDRLVAVKTLHSGRADDDERRRFEREGRALARLRDRRIVAVHATEAMGEDLLLVLEFVDGADLQDAVDRRLLDGGDVLRVLGDVAGALDAAAAAGIVHRDVKPANVLVARDGGAKLTDFGIARLAGAAGAFRTGTAMPVGTPRYMPPEQVLDPEHESPAGDAYSFAAMAYEVLLGRPPFTAPDVMQLLYAHVNVAPAPPRELRPELSSPAHDILLAGLAKDPRARPTPVELAAVLAAHPADWTHLVAAGKPAPAETVPAPVTGEVASRARIARQAAASVPVVTPLVFVPDAPGRRIPAVLVGAVVAAAVLVVVLLVLL